MAKSIGSYVVVVALLFLSMEGSLMGTAQAASMGQALQALAPKLQTSELLSNPGFKINLPQAAHDFISQVKSKVEEDPSILQQPASWEGLLSFVELASGRSKSAHKRSHKHIAITEDDDADYEKKTPVQKIVHHLFEEEGVSHSSKGKGTESTDNKPKGEELVVDDANDQTAEVATEEAPQEQLSIKSSPFQMVLFFVVTLAVIGGLRSLALFLPRRHKNVDPIDYIIGTKFTMGSMVAGLVAGFAFSFVDSIVLYSAMIFLSSLISKLPGADEEKSYAAYANIFSNLVSGAVSTSAGALVSSAMNVDGEQAPFWSQLAGALLGGIIGVMLAKLIPQTRRLRAQPVDEVAAVAPDEE